MLSSIILRMKTAAAESRETGRSCTKEVSSGIVTSQKLHSHLRRNAHQEQKDAGVTDPYQRTSSSCIAAMPLWVRLTKRWNPNKCQKNIFQIAGTVKWRRSTQNERLLVAQNATYSHAHAYAHYTRLHTTSTNPLHTHTVTHTHTLEPTLIVKSSYTALSSTRKHSIQPRTLNNTLN